MTVELDGRLMSDREAAHRAIAQALGFPDYYGANLDALWDLLSVAGPTDITLLHAPVLLEALGAYGCSLLAVFYDAAQTNPLLTFHVASDGAGQDSLS